MGVAKSLLSNTMPATPTELNHQLVNAAKKGRVEELAFLLKLPGVDVNATDAHRDTVLIWAIRSGCLATVLALLQDPNITINKIGRYQRTPLITAALWANGKNRFAIVTALLNMPNIQLNLADIDGCTALILAAEKGHLDTVKALLTAKANVNIADKCGYTALLCAAYFNHIMVSHHLIMAYAIVNTENENSQKILLQVLYHGKNEAVYQLLSAMQFRGKVFEKPEYTSLPEFAVRCIKEVFNMRKNIFDIARAFLKGGNNQKKGRVLPVLPMEILKKIMFEPIIYPPWYQHRVQQDVGFILDNMTNITSQVKTKKAGVFPKPLIFSSVERVRITDEEQKTEALEMQLLTSKFGRISLSAVNEYKPTKTKWKSKL
jgi:ankyrin repeat protein